MKDLIYNQRDIPKEKWRYGFRSSAAVGCGWIAVHNALRLMGYRVEIPRLIRYFEWQLPLLHGNGGTSLFGPAVLFTQWGFPVKPCFCRKKFDQAAKYGDVCILFFRWRKGWKLGAHFVALRHTETGFVGYNTYRNSSGPDLYGPSLDDFLKEKKYFGAVLFGIRDRRNAK